MTGDSRVSLENIERAARVIDPVFLRTPQFLCEPLGEALGARGGTRYSNAALR